MNQQETQRLQKLLDELGEIKGPGKLLRDWNLRAQTFLIFLLTKYPELIFGDETNDEY